ncbi:MAG: deoxyribodipyrimidine photolyase [Pirellula sp.]|nr:deoxyribodipyrimidine photolyase [Pirellula sp.]
MVSKVPAIRIRLANPVGMRDGDYVLYWMTAFRRTRYNFALQRAVEIANEQGKPLLIFEGLRCHYRWNSDRFHKFVIDSMLDNAAAIAVSNATYSAWVESGPNEASGMVELLASRACAVVSDDFPCFFHPTLYSRIANNWPCRLELVDSNTVVPMVQLDRTFTVAHSYRRAIQKLIYEELPEFPVESPLSLLRTTRLKKLPNDFLERWPVPIDKKAIAWLKQIDLNGLPIDHQVQPTTEQGGEIAARASLHRFVSARLSSYTVDRNEPEKSGASGLSPYMHFGNMSPHEVFQAIASAEGWRPEKLSKPNGKMEGYWNMSPDAEAFMDQLMTWREIGFNMCIRDRNYMKYESLPDWAQQTLEEHASDPRPHVYSLEEFEKARTHDPLWNAAQRQLVREGRIHNYLRMLWGKKILHWTETPRQALKVMIELNNKYALDGRDPNSYSGIMWVLGRYDRAWGPERPIFGKIRYMTSESTQNKFQVKQYIRKFSD